MALAARAAIGPHQMQSAKALNRTEASERLASDKTADIANLWQEVNELKRFVCAFLLEFDGTNCRCQSTLA